MSRACPASPCPLPHSGRCRTRFVLATCPLLRMPGSLAKSREVLELGLMVAYYLAVWRGVNMLKDLSYAARTLLRSPGFAIAAVLSLALGLGANTALFSAVDAVLLRPFPYPDPDRVALVWSSATAHAHVPVSIPDFQAYRDRTHSFDTMAAYFDAVA